MGASAFLICSCNRIVWGLGKPLQNPDYSVIKYYGTPDEPVYSESVVASAVLWKLFADHVGHRLRVVHDSDPELDRQMSTGYLPAMLDGDGKFDISSAQYLAGWPEEGFGELVAAGFDGGKDGVLACAPCAERLLLGRALLDPESDVLFFHRGGADDPPNSRQPELNKAAWYFLTRHFEHPLRVIAGPDGSLAGYRTIGGDSVDDIPLAVYIEGFPG